MIYSEPDSSQPDSSQLDNSRFERSDFTLLSVSESVLMLSSGGRHRRGGSRGKRPPIRPFKPSIKPDQWSRELLSMWRAWMPPKRSVIWKILGVSLLISTLQASLSLPLQLAPLSLNSWWTPLTAGWVEPAHSSLMLILILGWVAASKSGALKGKVTRPRYFGYAVSVLLALSVIAVILGGFIYALATQGLMLIWFGYPLERRLGSRRFLTLCCVTLISAYTIGGLYLTTFSEGIKVSGLQPLTRALIIAWGYQMGHTHLALLNIKGYQIRWIVYAFAGFEVLLYPAPIGVISLGAAATVDLWIQRNLAH